MMKEQGLACRNRAEAPYIGFMGKDFALLTETGEYDAEQFVSFVAKEANARLTWRKDLVSIVVVNLGAEEDIPRILAVMKANEKKLKGSICTF